MRVKLKCFAVEAMIGPIEILHCTELLVPSGEINCKVGQKARSKRVLVFLWEKVEGFPVEDNGLIEVPHPPTLASSMSSLAPSCSFQEER